MIEMFPDQGGSIAIGADVTESGDPAVSLQAAGEALRLLRTMAHMTLQQVAAGADTSIAYLSKVERNVLTPTDEYVAKVAAHISHSMLKDAA